MTNASSSHDRDIEVYELDPGSPIPSKPGTAIVVMKLAPDAHVPMLGDLLELMVGGGMPERYKVIARTHLAGSTSSDPPDGIVAWWKMWIFVERA